MSFLVFNSYESLTDKIGLKLVIMTLPYKFRKVKVVAGHLALMSKTRLQIQLRSVSESWSLE